jgi:hypothetical protein
MDTNLPKFLVIGVQKAATSWLWVQLRSHPEVWMPPVKELHYFDHLYVPDNRKWTGWHIKTHVGKSVKWHQEQGKAAGPYFTYLKGLLADDMFTEPWYRRAYGLPAAKGKVTGDITPEYCMITREGVSYATQLLGKAKIIVMVRHPVDRALSQLRMNAKNRGVDLASASLEQWLDLAKDPVIYSRARYSEFIPLWRSAFGEENLLILPYTDVGKDPIQLLRKVEAFIGAGHGDYADAGAKVYETSNKQTRVPPQVGAHLTEQLAQETRYFEALETL